MRRDGAKIQNFRLSEREIFVRGQPKTQTGLNRLNKFQFARTRFGSEKARCPKRSSEKSHRFCPTRLGKNSDYEAGVARSITTWSDGAILAWNVRETSRIARRAETNPLLQATHAFSAM